MAIGLRSFFQRTPKKGKPIALRGFAQGVADVDECLWSMSIAGGYIDRTNRRNWVIVPDASSPFGVNHDAANQDTATLIETLDRDSLGFLQIRGARNRGDTGYTLDTLDAADKIPVFDESEKMIKWAASPMIAMPGIDSKSIDYDSSGNLQWKDFDNPQTTTLADGDLFGVKDADASGVLRYVSAADLSDYCITIINDTGVIDHQYLDYLRWEISGHYAGVSDRGKYARFNASTGVAEFADAGDISADILHSGISDVDDQTVGDDHRGNRTAASAINEGGVDGHPYLHANGDSTRNLMPSGAKIKMQDATSATASNGALIMSGGLSVENIYVNDTTTPTSSVGGIRIPSGGISSEKGWFGSIEGGDTSHTFQLDIGNGAALFERAGENLAYIAYEGFAGGFINTAGTISVELVNATDAILATGDIKISDTSGDYYHNDQQGVTGDGFSGGIKVSSAAAESSIINSTMFGGLL